MHRGTGIQQGLVTVHKNMEDRSEVEQRVREKEKRKKNRSGVGVSAPRFQGHWAQLDIPSGTEVMNGHLLIRGPDWATRMPSVLPVKYQVLTPKASTSSTTEKITKHSSIHSVIRSQVTIHGWE